MKALKKNLMMQMTAVLLAFVCVFGMTAAAEEASSDYYLYDLGLQNGQLQEDWEYYNTEYNVVVPEGTQSLELSPELSNYAANIVEITDTTIGEDGTATVDVTVEAENGAQLTYTLHVTTEGAAPAAAEENAEAAEGQTEAPKAEEKDAAQAALESEANLRAQIESEAAIREQASQEKIQSLNGDIASLNNKIDMILKVCYGLIALCVVLLFFIINQSLRNKDLKEELKDANSMAGDSYEFARRTQSMRTDNYYAPAQNAAPAEEMPQEPQLSKREQKAAAKAAAKAEKAAAKAAKKEAKHAAPVQQVPEQQAPAQQPIYQQPQQAPVEQPIYQQPQQAPVQQPAPANVQDEVMKSSIPEQDVDVDMIDL